MPLKKRIIPCFDIKNGQIVKGINFTNFADLAELGDPVSLAKEYEKQSADELIFIDLDTNYQNREMFYEIIKSVAKKLSIPITVGGGIRTIDDIKKFFNCGVDKISISSSIILNPEFVKKASEMFKKQIIAVIDSKIVNGRYATFIGGGRENAGVELVDLSKKCEELGVGEILLTSIDADGTKNGYDIPMISTLCNSVNIPVIASGGCGKIEDIINVFKETNCDAVSLASLLHYKITTILNIKNALKNASISCKI